MMDARVKPAHDVDRAIQAIRDTLQRRSIQANPVVEIAAFR
jgi:hypothetical protein